MYTEILNFVDPAKFDQKKLDEYLTSHTVIEPEVFGTCAISDDVRQDHVRMFEHLYFAVQRDVFLRRMPFYFATVKYDDMRNVPFSIFLAMVLGSSIKNEESAEHLYLKLEYLFYDWEIPLDKMVAYLHDQNPSNQRLMFAHWVDYLHLCEQLGWDVIFPKRLNTSYNKALEAVGRKPIIYEVEEFTGDDYWLRMGHVIEVTGEFPCDDEGNPILKWSGVRVKNAVAITCDCKKSGHGYIKITLGPRTVIHLLNCYNSDEETDDIWYQIYAGPLQMEFDHEYIQTRRKQMQLTQKNVADAIGTSVRTYQKWENGETTPDGHYLLRLLNWLDIPSQQAVKWIDE